MLRQTRFVVIRVFRVIHGSLFRSTRTTHELFESHEQTPTTRPAMSNVIDEVGEGFDPLPELLSVMAESATPTLLALDIGTSGMRAALFDERGEEIPGTSLRINSYDTTLLTTGTVEADILLDLVTRTIDEVLANIYDQSARIELISISCFWHSLLGVDRNGRPTTPVLGWNDTRAAAEGHHLRSRFNEAEFHSRTGCRFHSSYWPAKLLRLRDKKPEEFARTARWISFSEYLALQFFGESLISVSMASATGLLNQRTCQWEPELLDGLNLDIEKLPQICRQGQTLDQLTEEYAARWPQLSNARFFPAIGDGAANNLGAACISKDNVALMVGTSGAMRVVYEGEPPHVVPPELWCYRVDRRRVVIGGALSDGGNLFGWLRDSLLSDIDSQSIEEEIARMGPDEHGLTVLPFWFGERSTGWNERMRGTIHGLSSETQPIEILRAAMEAVAYRFALIADALIPLAPDASLIASGRALWSSPAWVQILADVLGSPIQVSETDEASTRGAALLALEATGKIQTINRHSVTVTTIPKIFEPDTTRHQRYRDALERQQQLYRKMVSQN